MQSYKIISHKKSQDKSHDCIQVLDGKFKNIVVQVHKVSFGMVENVDGTIECSFDYDIIENPNKIKIENDFRNSIGDIIIDIILSKQNLELTKEDNEPRKGDPKKSSTKRRVRKKGSTVSKK